MATTSKGIPYPVGADNNNTAQWLLDLATWLDAALGGLTDAQITALSGAALWTGRTVFNTTTKVQQYYNGTAWRIVGMPPASILWTASTSATAPVGTLRADGQAVSRTTYADLFAHCGVAHGTGNGTTTFNVPNLAGRTMCGFTSGQTEFNVVGKIGGAKTVTLVTANIPSHAHTGGAHTHTSPAHNHSETVHSHEMSHGHASTTTGFSGTHAHGFGPEPGGYEVWAQTGAGGANAMAVTAAAAVAGWTTSTVQAGNHQHTFTPTPFTGSTLNNAAASTGLAAVTVDAGGAVPTSYVGSDTAFAILNPYITLNAWITI